MRLDQKQLAEAATYMESGDWRAAHEIVQKDEESMLACWAHGIVHLMEGDVPNAKYWYREARRSFPAHPSIPGEIAALRTEIGL